LLKHCLDYRFFKFEGSCKIGNPLYTEKKYSYIEKINILYASFLKK
jgi:hypothetical protein